MKKRLKEERGRSFLVSASAPISVHILAELAAISLTPTPINTPYHDQADDGRRKVR